MRSVNRILAATTSVRSDDVRVVDSTPVECGRSHETVKRSDLAGWAEYGYCESAPDRLSSATRTTSAVVSNANCPSMNSSRCGLPVKMNGNGLAQPCSSR
jgi:hypothetical protein